MANAESVGDIDLSTGLSEEDRVRREAFLQDLMPQERVAEYVREVAEEDRRAAREAQRETQEEREWAAHAAAEEAAVEDTAGDPVAGAVAEAVAAVSGSGDDRRGVEAAPEPERNPGTPVDAAQVEPVVATGDQKEGGVVSSASVSAGVGNVEPVPPAAAAAPHSVHAEIVREDEGSEQESDGEGVTIDARAEPASTEAGGAAEGAAQQQEPARGGSRVRRRGRNSGAAASGGAREAGLDDLIADEDNAAGFDDTGFVDTWLHGTSGGGGAAERGLAGGAGTADAGRVDTRQASGESAPSEVATMDAISRALKAGVDKETLKRYIDEVAEQVADNAGAHACRVRRCGGRRGVSAARAVLCGARCAAAGRAATTGLRAEVALAAARWWQHVELLLGRHACSVGHACRASRTRGVQRWPVLMRSVF